MNIALPWGELPLVSQWWVLTSVISVYLFFTSEAWKLRHIPTAGFSGWPVLSYIATFQFIFYGDDLLREYQERYQGKPFKVAYFTRWLVVINSGSEDLKVASKWPDSVAQALPAFNELFRHEITVGPISVREYHLVALINRITRNMNSVINDVRNELEISIQDVLAPSDEWQSYQISTISTQIVSRAVARMIVGEDLCRNKRLLDICVGFSKEIIKTAILTSVFFPSYLKSLAPYVLSGTAPMINDALKEIKPIVERSPYWRLSGNSQIKSKTSLDWIIDMADGDEEEYSLDSLVRRILHLSFASIHTSSITYERVLYNLCRHPEHIGPLREEAEEAVSQDGWSMSALKKMKKLDSFIQETYRMMPLSNIQPVRMIMKDYFLDDGTLLPKGTIFGFRTDSLHMDDTVYPDPERFDGFRFYDMNVQGQKNNINTPSPNFVMFGTGKDACPGRFIATLEVNLLVSYLLLHFDIKGKAEKKDTSPHEIGQRSRYVPRDTGEFSIRRRQI